MGLGLWLGHEVKPQGSGYRFRLANASKGTVDIMATIIRVTIKRVTIIRVTIRAIIRVTLIRGRWDVELDIHRNSSKWGSRYVQHTIVTLLFNKALSPHVFNLV